ncbi:MAG TPA: hypothetical protein VD973_27640 [Symbiobacteriaceae bacterium]|nr:hypothetical protein [Symbiobacteriaceae bacterium]
MAAVSLLVVMLKVLLWALAWAAGVLLAVALLALVLVLFVPVGFRTRAEGALRPDDDETWGGQAEWEADLRWGGRLVRLWLQGTHQGVGAQEITILGFRLRERKRSGPAEAKEEAPSASKPPAKAKVKAKARKKRQRPTMEEIRAYIREGLNLARRLIKALRLHIAGDLTFGFEDPALTGFALGAIALTGKPADLTLRPDWFQPGAEGWVSIKGRVYGFEAATALWLAYWRSPLSRRLRRWIPFTSYGR